MKYVFLFAIWFGLFVCLHQSTLFASPSSFETYSELSPLNMTVASTGSIVIGYSSVTVTNSNLCTSSKNGSICVIITHSGLALNNYFDLSVDNGKTWTTGATGTSTMCKSSLAAGSYNVIIRDRNSVTLSYPGNPIVVASNICIPDDNLKTALVANTSVNTNGDTEIQLSEAEAFADTLDLSSLSISDLTGIEKFTKLVNLDCSENTLASIDVSSNTLLKKLNCSGNSITALDISSNSVLEELNCSDNSITALDISSNSALEELDCSENSLTSLDVSRNTNLKNLNFNTNSISSIDLSENTNLNYLYCNSNTLSSLDITNNTKLYYLYCNHNNLSALDISQCSSLTKLYCSYNNIIDIDLEGMYSIEYLDCSHNSLTQMDFIDDGGMYNIKYLYCNNNDITEIDLLNGVLLSLYYLDCKLNELTTLDISGVDLYHLNCVGNYLTSLNLSGCYKLHILDCYNNSLTELDVTECTSLVQLRCHLNRLTSLDLRNGNTSALTVFNAVDNYLTCISVSDVDYAEANFTDIDAGVTFMEDCGERFYISNVDHTDNACYKATEGTITITVSGGTEPYQYSIDNGTTWQSSEYFDSLGEGDYYIQVKDANNDTISLSSSVYIEDPFPLNLSYNTKGDNGSSNGQIILLASSATPPYTYSIDGGLNYFETDTFSNLAAGTYPIAIRDYNLCITTTEVVVSDLSVILLNATPTNITSCYGESTGVITLSASGGVGTYWYSIDNGTNWQESNIFSNLPAGNYYIKVKDDVSTDAWSSNPVVVTQPSEISYSFILTDPKCNGGNNGSIEFSSVTGGTSSFSYSIDNGSNYFSSKIFDDLSSGSYNLRVKDSNGCVKSYSGNPVSMSDPTIITPIVTSTNISHCDSLNNGTITVSVSDSAGISYSIDNGSTWQRKNVFRNLPAGNYNVVIKNSNECLNSYYLNPVKIKAYQLSEIMGVEYIEISCVNAADGRIAILGPEGGTTYEITGYSIDGGATWQSDYIFTNIGTGTYNLMMKDENGCADDYDYNPIVFEQPDPIIITGIEITGDNGSSNGKIEISATGHYNSNGEYDDFEYSINGGDDYDYDSIYSGLTAGSYDIVVFRSENYECFADTTIAVPDLSIKISSVEQTNITGCHGDETGSITINATGGSGSLYYSADNGTSWQSSYAFTGLAVGAYYIKVKDETENTLEWDSNPITITEPDELSFTIQRSNPVCFGENTGQIYFYAVTGGTGTINYSLDGGTSYQSDYVFGSLPSGNYIAQIKDANNCIQTYSGNPIILSDPSQFTISDIVSTNNSTCGETGNGSIAISYSYVSSTKVKTLNTKALTSHYYYSIDNGSTWQTDSSIFRNLTGGSYSIIVKDNKGCLAEWEANPVMIDDINTVSIDSVLTEGDDGSTNGQIEVYVSGGSMPYSYQIDENGWQTSNIFSSLTAAEYRLQVSDLNGCKQSQEVTVDNLLIISEDETLTNTSFNDGETNCIDAYQTITVGDVSANPVDFNSGSSTSLIAGSSILFLPGVHISQGAYLSATITTDSTFCNSTESVLVVKTSQKSPTIIDKISDMTEEGSILVYPNPNNGCFQLKLSGVNGLIDIVIYNSIGSVIYKMKIDSGITEVNLPVNTPGLYFAKTTDKMKPITQKFIIE